MKRTIIIEDSNGLPKAVVVEGKDIEVEFEHKGRKASALFEIDGGWEVVAKSYWGPAEYADITTEFVGAVYLDGNEENIPDSEIDPHTILALENEAMDLYEPEKPEKDYPPIEEVFPVQEALVRSDGAVVELQTNEIPKQEIEIQLGVDVTKDRDVLRLEVKVTGPETVVVKDIDGIEMVLSLDASRCKIDGDIRVRNGKAELIPSEIKAQVRDNVLEIYEMSVRNP